MARNQSGQREYYAQKNSFWSIGLTLLPLELLKCFAMIGRADIEGSKNDVAMEAWPPQTNYPYGNFSDTSSWKLFKLIGSIGRTFAVPKRTEHWNQASFCSFALREVFVLAELVLGHRETRPSSTYATAIISP
ncbi:hypothetical protein ILUMI_16380 [Ignelater luminosus]|uniref:Uncharacterized protein n=1 Tax=Ignelater luminosus TaxID=2038154 RepID=A0A8K0CLW9_IGNLU|nr:hypothetical protein ILUMI_16380 [Ignelater luminosus]